MDIYVNESALYDEVQKVNEMLPISKESSEALEKIGTKIFLNERCTFVQLPTANNSFVQSIFSIMKNTWTDERNRLNVEMVKAEICTKMNYEMDCQQLNHSKLSLRNFFDVFLLFI